MRSKYLAIVSAAVLLAACASEPEETTATTSTGSAAHSGGEIGADTSALPAEDKGSQEWLLVNVGDRVLFDYDMSHLSSEALDTVEKVAVWMENHPGVTLVLEGHADERGTREYNLALGERRANAVRDHLEALGVDTRCLSVISYGYEQPAASGSNESAWSQNRRAVFVVSASPRGSTNSALRQ